MDSNSLTAVEASAAPREGDMAVASTVAEITAPGVDDVQMAHGASPPASAAAPAATAESIEICRSNAPSLNCQAAVVRMGEIFGEFACSVFRAGGRRDTHGTATPPLNASRTNAAPRALSKGTCAPSSLLEAAAHTGISADQQHDRDYEGAAAAAAAATAPGAVSEHTFFNINTSPGAGAEGPEASGLGSPVNCEVEGVPRWELLIYALRHEGPLRSPGDTRLSGARSRYTDGDVSEGSHRPGAMSGAADDDTEGGVCDECPLPNDAILYFQQTMPAAKMTKVVKLEAGRRYTARVRCYSRNDLCWSAWSEPIHTATMFPVETRIVEIGSDYVHCTWDRVGQRNEEGLTRETDAETTAWARSIPEFELRFLQESDMAVHYHESFCAGCRSVTVHNLRPSTRYIVFMRYRTVIHTIREWTEVARLVTASPLEVRLISRGEDTFTFSWGCGVEGASGKASADEKTAACVAEDRMLGEEENAQSIVANVGYLQSQITVHQYEISIESIGLRFDPITVPASVCQYTMSDLFPSTTYAVCVRTFSTGGRWGSRSDQLEVCTASRPVVSVAAIGESFASFAWSRKSREEPHESQLQYRVQSMTSAYNQSATIDLASLSSSQGHPPRLLNVEHLRSGSDYDVTLRIAIEGTWGIWTEPLRFTTAPSLALTYLERGEDFLVLNWPSTGLEATSMQGDAGATATDPLPVYNIIVVKVDGLGERTAVLNERVTRDPAQRGFRVNHLESDTTYDVQCRIWERNPLSGFEGWGELSAPVRMRTLRSVALHVWDVGEDFIHIMWRRGLSEAGTALADATRAGGDVAADALPEWDDLKYEVVIGCVETGEDTLLHRHVLETSYTVTQLKPSTTYTISVRACDEQETWGSWSCVKVRTLASVKTTIHEIGEDFVRLMWQRCVDPVDVDLHGVTVADMFVSKYSVLVYGREVPGMPVVPHSQSDYEAGGGRSDIARFEVVSSEHTSLRVRELLPDREYVAVVRAATASGRWGLWSRPVRFRTNPQFRIPTNQLTTGENYVRVTWSRDEAELLEQVAAAQGEDTDDEKVQLGDWTVTGQELRINGVTSQYARQYALDPDVRELKVGELLPACAYTIQIRVRGRSGSWGLWSAPAPILTRGTIAVTADEVAEDFITMRWERRRVENPCHYPTGRGVVTSYRLRVYNVDGVHMETLLGDGDCPYRVTGLKPNTYYCVELKANYNDEEWGLWSTPLWCLTMQPIRIQTKLISEEFCYLRLTRPSQQRRLPEDDGNPQTIDRVLAHGKLRPTIMLCVTSSYSSKAPYNSAAVMSNEVKTASLNDNLPPDAANQRLTYQTELLSSCETVEHKVPNLKCNTVYSVSARTKLENGEWGMWSPSLMFATVPAIRVSFTSIGESFVGLEWARYAQVIPSHIENPEQVVLGIPTVTASRVRVRESGGGRQHTSTLEGATNSWRIDNLNPATTYMVCVQTFNDNYEWGMWSEEQKVRTAPGMDIHLQHVSEDALWVSWSRRTDLKMTEDANTAFNVNIFASAYEVCFVGEGGFTYTQETESTSLFFRGLMPDAVYTIYVRALFAESEYWGLWSAQAFRTKPRIRVTFGNIGEHFVMLEWRRHLPKPTDAEARLLLVNGSAGASYGSGTSSQTQAVAPLSHPNSNNGVMAALGGRSAASAGAEAHQPFAIAETEDIVQFYRFKVQRVGEAHSVIYNIAPTVCEFRLRDLQPSSEYRVWACAKGYEGVWGFWSDESRVRTLPKLRLDVLDIGEDYIRAQWKRGPWEGACMDENDGTEVRQVDGAVSGYEIRVLDAAGMVTTTRTTTSSETTAILSGLRLSALYTIQVRAKDTYDAWGLWTNPVSFYTLRPVTVGVHCVGETFVDAQWLRTMHNVHTQKSAEDVSDVTGMVVDEEGVLHPDDRVMRWHLRVSCNRVFAGMPKTDDYRDLYADEGVYALRIDGLHPHATYSIVVRGLNYAGEWGHWSPAVVVSTCPLLKVGIEVAGETFLQLSWHRPAMRNASEMTEAVYGHGNNDGVGMGASGGFRRKDQDTHNKVKLDESEPHTMSSVDPHVSALLQEGSDDEGDNSGLSYYTNRPLEAYLCFPPDSNVHNFQVTIRPMPTEPPFDETDEPLVDGARVYETTQPALRLGNLSPGTRYAISVREQQVDEGCRLLEGEWGAPSEVICTQTVPQLQVDLQEIGEDYCLVEWHRGAVASAADILEHDSAYMSAEGKAATATMLTAASSATAAYKAVMFELQTRRLSVCGGGPFTGNLAFDSVISVSSSVNTYHISNLVPSTVYEVRVRAKIENAQWGLWSLATRFITQSRLELRVDRVQEVAVDLSWCRPRLIPALSDGVCHNEAERRERCPTAAPVEDEEDLRGEKAPQELEGSTNSPQTGHATTEGTLSPPVIQADDAVHEYELVLEGISVVEHRRLTFTHETQSTVIENLQQDQLYCLSIRSHSERQHWSRFSTKVTFLTLAGVQVHVMQRTECSARLEWFRPPPDVGKFAEILERHQRDALHQCDDRERRELLEMKRKVQEYESKGESTTAAAGWVDPAAREEHNALLREETTRHYQAERVVVGDVDCTGYELCVTLVRGEVCLPFITEIEKLRRRRLSITSKETGLRDMMATAKRSVQIALTATNSNRGFIGGVDNGSFRDSKRLESVKTPTTCSPTCAESRPATAASSTGGAIALLDVHLRSSVSQVFLQGLSPNAVFSAQVRARGVPDSWQPWSQSVEIETLPLIHLDQSRFGEHYINLYWYRSDSATMAAVAQEAEEFRQLQREFHNLSERDLEERRSALEPAAYESLVSRLRRLRMLRRISAARAKQDADGEMGLLVDPSCPVQGFQLRVIDELGTISEHYLPNDQYHEPNAPPTLSFTATGLQPNNLYVCCLCPHYGDDVWGCWTVPLKYMTHNTIQLEITYISEIFVDLQWWRMDNKPLSSLDEQDTLLSNRYTEEVQVYQLRITHEDATTGEEVEEFRTMRACNVLRIDALLPDMKYAIAVREWDPKGDWGLWSATCSCVTLPSIETTVTEVKENSALLSWQRMVPRIDYENDMHVLEGNSEITGFYLRVEEVPLRASSSETSPTAANTALPVLTRSHSSLICVSDSILKSPDASKGLGGDTSISIISPPNIAGTSLEEGTRPADADELEGMVSFAFHRGGPLPPDAPPNLYDGLVPDHHPDHSGDVAMPPSHEGQHYLLVTRVSSSTEVEYYLADLRPHTVYQVQVMAETTGRQLGPWSTPHFFITTPRLRLSTDVIDEHYVSLNWGRSPLVPLVAQITGCGVASNGGALGYPPGCLSLGSTDEGRQSSGMATAGAVVTVSTSKVLYYELEVRGGLGVDFEFSTRIEPVLASGSFRVTGLTMDSVYVARARSFSDAGEASLWSPDLTFVTLKQLLVQPQEITESTIEMTWGRPEQIPRHYLPYARLETAVVSKESNAALVAAPAMLETSPMRREPLICIGDREAVKYQVRAYHVTDRSSPHMILDTHRNGNVTRLPVHSLAPNSVYLLYVRAINRDGVWSEWSEGRCVYTMKPLVTSIATVGEDFVRLRWAREAPEELHYKAGAATAISTAAGGSHRRSTVSIVTPTDGEDAEDMASVYGRVSLPEDADAATRPASAHSLNPDSPDTSRVWQQERRFRLYDQPADVGAVYCSAFTSIHSFSISVCLSDEAEGYTVEVPGHMSQHTLPALQPDSIYLIRVCAQYKSGERGMWSDVVRSGTYNLLTMDVKEVGEDYVSASWQRKANSFNMASLSIGKVEETVCYEVRVRDYTDVPLGEEEGETAQLRDNESRSVFLHSNQRHSIIRELLSNHRYRLSVRRWYQPNDGFAKGELVSPQATSISTLRSSVPNMIDGGKRDDRDGEEGKDGAAEEKEVMEEVAGSSPLSPAVSTALQLYEQTVHVVMDANLRESIEKAKAAPGVWSDSEYVVTLRDMVSWVERVGEEYFQLRWGRDPSATALPVRRPIPVKPIQNYQLRIDELLRDGSGIEASRGSNTFHMDELMAPTETSYFNKALKPNTLYKVEVRCCIENTWGRWSRPVYVITQPCLQVDVSRIGEECATLTWHRPYKPLTLPDGEVAVIGDEEDVDGSYQLEVSGVGFNYQVSKHFKASRTIYTVKHLEADALYSVRVRSGDDCGQPCSMWSDTACFATLKPIVVVVSMPTEQFVDVQWCRPPQTVEEYTMRLEQQAGSAGPSSPLALKNAATPPPQQVSDEGTHTTPDSPTAAAALHPSSAVQLGNPGSLAFHLCVFNTEETPSVAVLDKQFRKEASHYRVAGLAADTPYVVIVRACCEATNDWGLWSEERTFRTLKLLAPTVSSVGETYAELVWERRENDSCSAAGGSVGAAGGAHGTPMQPTKYLMAIRSTRYGTLEREISAEECLVSATSMPTQEGCLASSYCLSELNPGTEYAVALQPCYGGSHDWGLWSQVATFTTLYPVQLNAKMSKDAVELSWGRSCPTPTVGFMEDVKLPVVAPEVSRDKSTARASLVPAVALPEDVSSAITGSTLAGSRTVSRYQLVVGREADLATLPASASSLEVSMDQRHSSQLLYPHASPRGEGRLGEQSLVATSQRRRSLRNRQPQDTTASSTPGRIHSSTSSQVDFLTNAVTTTIPDMDMAALASRDGNAALTSSPNSIFRRQYDLTNAADAAMLLNPLDRGNNSADGVAGIAGIWSTFSMHERIEGLTPDTTYVARIRAMDLFGYWGAPVEVRLVTPPVAPAQVTLRRVNAQFCTLQWVTPGESLDDTGATVPRGCYHYVVEQCFVHADGPVPVGNATSSSGGGASARKAGGGGATSGAATVPTGAGWQVIDTVEDTNVCAVRISGLLSRMRCRVKCARRIPPASAPSADSNAGAAIRLGHLGPYSDYSEAVAVSSGTPPEGVVDPHLVMLSQNAATLEWLPPPKPSEAATGRYTRPIYRVYLANTTDQPYPVLLTTVQRPSYTLTHLTPSTTYTVQVVAENPDGVSFRNPILLFRTKSEDDHTVSRHEDSGDANSNSAESAAPLAEVVLFHGPRAILTEDDIASGGDDFADIPTAVSRFPAPPRSSTSRRPTGTSRAGRGRKSGGKRKGHSAGRSKKRGGSGGSRSGSKKRKSKNRSRSSSAPSGERSGSTAVKRAATGTAREGSTSPGSFLPQLAKTL